MAVFKQQELLRKIIENNRKPATEQESFYQLALSVGYAEDVAGHPEEFFQQQSWQELVAQIPLNDIINKLVNNALQTRSIHGSNNAIETVIKVVGGFAPTKLQVSSEEELSDEELERRIAEKKRQIEEQEAQNNSKTDENSSKQEENKSDTQ